MEEARIRIYLDDNPEPITDSVLPADVDIDTQSLADGTHRLTIYASDGTGKVGVRELPFRVSNGPGITVSGLRPNSVVHGQVKLSVNAFGSEEPFEPRRAESRSPVPVWVWVMCIFVVAWAVWYAASMWRVPSAYANTPTYSAEAAVTSPQNLKPGGG